MLRKMLTYCACGDATQADGKFVMYYSADQNGNGGKHCIGAAISDTAQGPYTPEPTALSCNTAQGGAIDPAGFIDTDGTGT
jgi:beta-xylosidase